MMIESPKKSPEFQDESAEGIAKRSEALRINIKRTKQKIIENIKNMKLPKISTELETLKLKNQNTFIFDFDGVLNPESFDEMIALALKNHPQSTERKAQVQSIMNQGMNGEISMTESLQKRFEVASITPNILKEYITKRLGHMASELQEVLHTLKEKNQQIFIYSGGFKEFITPYVAEFGISEDHIFANNFVLQNDGSYNFDAENRMSTSNGKAEQFAIHQAANKFPGKIIAIGDSQRDLYPEADIRIGYGEYNFRPQVKKSAENYLWTPTQLRDAILKTFE